MPLVVLSVGAMDGVGFVVRVSWVVVEGEQVCCRTLKWAQWELVGCVVERMWPAVVKRFLWE